MSERISIAELRRVEEAGSPADWWVEEDSPAVYWCSTGPAAYGFADAHLIVAMRNSLLALVEAVEAAQQFESQASYDFYPDSRVQARLALREKLARFEWEPQG